MNFCSHCGDPVQRRVPEGDDRERHVCTSCATVHYVNPRSVVGCLVTDEADRLLLCRRAIEPAHGRWTVPAGYLEVGESAIAGALRETFEEAGARVRIAAPHSRLDMPHIGQFYELFRARVEGPLQPFGLESSEVAWFDLDEVPWAELAFPVVHWGLRLFHEDARAARFHLHHGVLRWDGDGDRYAADSYVLEEHWRTPLHPAET